MYGLTGKGMQMETRKTLCVATSLSILLLAVGVQPSAAEEIFVDGVRRVEKETRAVQEITKAEVANPEKSGGDRIVNGVPYRETEYQARFPGNDRSFGDPKVVTEPKVMAGAEPRAADEKVLNGLPYCEDLDQKAGQRPDVNGFTKSESTADVVGSDTRSATDFALAKGNSYRVDTTTFLREAEFWLEFSDTQTLSFYVFQSPVEFGTYNLVWSRTSSVSGVGASWYSTGPLDVLLEAGNHYIIAVSWDGTMTYFFDTADSEPTSFGAYTHGYASGIHPLGNQITSNANDQAVYYQRLTKLMIIFKDGFESGNTAAWSSTVP